MSRTKRKLTKKPDEAMIAGVCAGLADYYDTDPTLVRAIFIAASVVGGFGPALYVVLWILLDDAEPEPPAPPLPATTPVVADTEPPQVDTVDDNGGTAQDQPKDPVPDPAPTRPAVEPDQHNATPGL